MKGIKSNIKTYLLFDGRYFKIGSSYEIKKRVKQLRTANPDIMLIASSDWNIEDYLHNKYKKYNYKYEWFKFSKIKDQFIFIELWLEFSDWYIEFPIKKEDIIFNDKDFDIIVNKVGQDRRNKGFDLYFSPERGCTVLTYPPKPNIEKNKDLEYGYNNLVEQV